MHELQFLIITVIILALVFDFINGFHDTANAIATSVSTRALKPRTAIIMAAILNFFGAMYSTGVAKTIGGDIVKSASHIDEHIIIAALVGAIVWNLFTWLYGLPSSSSHALLGGLVGSTMAGLGFSGVKWTGDGTKLDGVVGKILLPAVISPVIALLVAAVGTWLIFRITRGVAERYQQHGFRVEKIDPVRYKEFVVSSTRIRRLISEGRVDEAGALLGHHYAVDGVDDERVSGGLAGVLGVGVVLVLTAGIAYAVRRRPDSPPEAEAGAGAGAGSPDAVETGAR